MGEFGTREDGLELWPVYDSVFADYPDIDSWLAAVWDKHRVRSGFRLARSYSDDVLTGFAYGYTGTNGQWWTDNVRDVMEPDVAARWLGGHFELVSIGVTQGVRGQGVGRRLMRTLCSGLPHERQLLMTTADPADPARRLYESEGWRVLSAGVSDATVTMGRFGHATDEE
ncbi:GNAT family N-acetyltransferase [Nocardioides sp. AX2bis]|uniref:GNAT family N-acetyltransferase n=1 Tax=Nocardioides sp. AX2bis TaxID=2653157 RepID=UPI00135A97B0|nr:GNAT family N-acetyltransferase [Nocardioides sp. AX2bis]